MKKTTKSAFHRGFTLIELMIVIVILGILMGTILPRLSGAQGRARDTARTADLNTIAQALELYYDDFGAYPGVTGTGECMDNTLTNFDVFKTYFKGDLIPTPPQSGEIVDWDGDGNADCTSAYAFLPLDAKSVDSQGYALVANVEVPTKGNYITKAALSVGTQFAYGVNTTVGDVNAVIPQTPGDMSTAESEDDTGASTVFVLVN